MSHLQHFFNQNKKYTEQQQITTCCFFKTSGVSALFCIFAFGKRREIRKLETVVYHMADFGYNQLK